MYTSSIHLSFNKPAFTLHSINKVLSLLFAAHSTVLTVHLLCIYFARQNYVSRVSRKKLAAYNHKKGLTVNINDANKMLTK